MIKVLPHSCLTSLMNVISAGDIYNGVHVLWVPEAVLEANQTKREEASAAGVETLVHTDPLGAQVHVMILFTSSLPHE